MYSWLSKKVEGWTANTTSPTLAAAASFVSQGLQMAAGLDQTYVNTLNAQRDIQNIQVHGLKGGFQQSVSDSYGEIKEIAGTSDIVRAVDYEGRYSVGERIVYGASGLGKSFLIVLGGVQGTRAMSAKTAEPPPIPKLETPPEPQLTPKQQNAVKSIHNAVDDHLQPKDISGAVADQSGTPIPKQHTEGYWDHSKEVGDAMRGVRKNVEKLKGVNNTAAQEAVRKGQEAVKKAEDAVKGAGI